ncbi:MAG TPA: tyrosine--tRNA ligase, partial [Candidatus Fermentibacter sp.]|nr:tyrosine--tRNA ligase [Candidatus Fermentibacter sp.]
FQVTDEDDMLRLLDQERLVFYAGFDATASSLHLGHMVPLMAASWLQKAGHKPLILVGGATALVSDPSGRSTERTVESRETVDSWVGSISTQMRRFLRFGRGPSDAELLNNADWLDGLGYLDFIRDIGKHFSVNRMLTADSVRLRLEKGLSFLEFNYMLLQAYDFLHLYRSRGCTLEIGGADQWGNIVAGIELVRRTEGSEVYGMTCPLVTSSNGEKMSKSMPGGAVWLDPAMTSPYDYYQFWMNVDDRDVAHFMKLYTFLTLGEIDGYASLRGEKINEAKSRLAWEATAIAHGTAEADKARDAARALFVGSGDIGSVPTFEAPLAGLSDRTLSYTDLFVASGLCPSRTEVRRLAKQNGLSAGGSPVTDPDARIDPSCLEGDSILLRVGKKKYCRIIFG